MKLMLIILVVVMAAFVTASPASAFVPGHTCLGPDCPPLASQGNVPTHIERPESRGTDQGYTESGTVFYPKIHPPAIYPPVKIHPPWFRMKPPIPGRYYRPF